MGFIIDLNGPKAQEGTVKFDDVDLSRGIRKVEIIAEAGNHTYAILTISVDKLNGKTIMGDI